MADIRRMQLGQVVDFCISYNERYQRAEKVENGTRKATQSDIDAFFG